MLVQRCALEIEMRVYSEKRVYGTVIFPCYFLFGCREEVQLVAA